MKDVIKERVINEAHQMINTNNTIRQIAKDEKISKSTVHKDLNERLKIIDLKLYKKVKKIINLHIKTRHIKGGESTKKKYQNKTKNL